jgi:hypothetical protein
MKRFSQTNKGAPLCKFGPGGDYVDEWDTSHVSGPLQKESHLGQVLTVIAELIGATVQPEILTEIACALPVEAEIEKPLPKTLSFQEKTADGAKHTNHTQATRNASAGRKLSKEPMLFSDDWGAGGGAKHQPNHRIRTHRRASRKRTAGSVNGQGTLFTIDQLGRKTA